MKRLIFFIMILVCMTTFTFAQNSELEKEKEGIKQAALDYMEGAHEGNADRIERSVHPELNKVSIRSIPKFEKQILYKAGFTRLLELVRANVIPLEGENKEIKVTIFAVKEGLACAKAVSPMFYDYLQLAKIDGKWKLINVLWRRNDSTKSDVSDLEKENIKQTALNYIDGAYSGNAERMAKAVHPQLNKVIPYTLPQTGKMMLDYSSAEMLIEGTRAKLGLLEEDKRNIKLKILDVNNDIATVEILSTMYYDYLHLAKINNEWKIVNVLWKMNPDAPKPKRN